MLLRNCCCCSLRTGALVVGIVFLTFTALLLLSTLIAWGAVDAESAGRSGNYYRPVDGVDVLASLSVLAAIQLVFDSLLVHGTRISPNQPALARRLILSWLAFRAVMFALASLSSFGLLITAIVIRYSNFPRDSIVFGVVFPPVAIFSLLLWYAWVAVLSFYWQLRVAGGAGVTYSNREAGLVALGGASASVMPREDPSGAQKRA